jgi:hypothetical protein
MAQHGVRHKAVDGAVIAALQRQAQQRQRVERVAGRHVQPHARGMAQPAHMAVGPFALARDAGRSRVGVALQQRAQQHGAVLHVVADALQRLRQLRERQPGIGRDEVEMEGDLLHGGCVVMGI